MSGVVAPKVDKVLIRFDDGTLVESRLFPAPKRLRRPRRVRFYLTVVEGTASPLRIRAVDALGQTLAVHRVVRPIYHRVD